MSTESFEQFHEFVLRTPSLQIPIRNIEDKIDFIENIVALGKELEYDFTVQEVYDALAIRNKAWIERWLD